MGGKKEKEVREEWTDAVNVRPIDPDTCTISMFQIVLFLSLGSHFDPIHDPNLLLVDSILVSFVLGVYNNPCLQLAPRHLQVRDMRSRQVE